MERIALDKLSEAITALSKGNIFALIESSAHRLGFAEQQDDIRRAATDVLTKALDRKSLDDACGVMFGEKLAGVKARSAARVADYLVGPFFAASENRVIHYLIDSIEGRVRYQSEQIGKIMKGYREKPETFAGSGGQLDTLIFERQYCNQILNELRGSDLSIADVFSIITYDVFYNGAQKSHLVKGEKYRVRMACELARDFQQAMQTQSDGKATKAAILARC